MLASDHAFHYLLWQTFEPGEAEFHTTWEGVTLSYAGCARSLVSALESLDRSQSVQVTPEAFDFRRDWVCAPSEPNSPPIGGLHGTRVLG